MPGEETHRWRGTTALGRAATVVMLALLAGVSLGRPALVLMAVPFALGTAWSLAQRPAAAPAVVLRVDPHPTVEGGPLSAEVVVRNPDPVRLLCVVSAHVSSWVWLHHGVGRYVSLLGRSESTVVRLEGTVGRWGRQRVGPVAVRDLACDGLLVAARVLLAAQTATVLPRGERFDSGQQLPRAAGMVGIHSSRRHGDAADLAEVRQFQPGDRLRRINWRVTRRTGDVHVNATLSDRDADVVLLLDARREAGPSGGFGGAASLRDVTVRAAAAITEHYAHQGDRVALAEFGPRPRLLRAGSGRRHYQAALEWLVDLGGNPGGVWPVDRLLGSGLLPPRATVLMLTPLLDEQSAHGLAVLARSGRPLVAVDVLPADLHAGYGHRWGPAAERLWRLERANTVGRLREVGVPVEPWQGAGSLDVVLRHAHRMASGSRQVRR